MVLGSPLRKAFYTPKSFFRHAASLVQAFAHCPIFSTAASRRSLARVSVPVLADKLSLRLPVIALVGRYPANKLIGRGPFSKRLSPLPITTCVILGLSGISLPFDRLSLSCRYVTHVLLTRLPLTLRKPKARSTCMPYPRRQRSSWTRIKSSTQKKDRDNSKKLYLVYYLIFKVLLFSLVYHFDSFLAIKNQEETS